MTDDERFWSNVRVGSDDECWPWLRCRKGGYGIASRRGLPRMAHRVAWSIANGREPPPFNRHGGPVIMHKCDNRSCCNPRHLTLGTQLENIADRDAKGRQHRPIGEKNPTAKVTAADVLEIRATYAARGATAIELAAKYGTSRSQIKFIVSGRSWSDVGGPVLRRGVASGENSGQSKLTTESVREIRAACEAGETQKSAAQRFGVTQMTISKLLRRLTWAHVA